MKPIGYHRDGDDPFGESASQTVRRKASRLLIASEGPAFGLSFRRFSVEIISTALAALGPDNHKISKLIFEQQKAFQDRTSNS